jgi:hypothetical protein
VKSKLPSIEVRPGEFPSATARCNFSGCAWWQTYDDRSVSRVKRSALAGLRAHGRMKHGARLRRLRVKESQ